MDPMKAAAEWLRSTVFKDEAIRPQAPRSVERLPSLLRAARSLETGVHRSYQSGEALFLKQGKLLAGYEDDYSFHDSVTCYYPTYQALTDRQLRGYFSWRTKLRRGEVCQTSLSFAFLYIYELLNQIGVADPMDGYRRLVQFRDAYGAVDGHILSYLGQWRVDYVVYYGLDRALLSDTPQVVLDQSAAVLEQIQERTPAEIIQAVRQLSHKWLGRSKFYAEHQADMDTVIVRVLRRASAHYAAQCKRTMVEQYFGIRCQWPVRLFDSAVFCDPLKRRSYQYAVDEQCVYRCENGVWAVRGRAYPPGAGERMEDLLKAIDSAMRQEFGHRHPIKAKLDTKWLLRIIQEEVSALSAERKAAEEQKISIDYAQLTKIRRDAAITREKLIVEEEAFPPEGAPPLEEPAPQETEPEQLTLAGLESGPEPEPPAPAGTPPGPDAPPLSPAQYRLLQCLLYGGDTAWVQAEGHLLSVLVDGINEALYDTFLDTVLDDSPQLIEDYIDDLKEMVHP